MQENNFEKEVRQKMEELSFMPSDSVWRNVSGVIGERKRNYRVLALLLGFLLLGMAAIFLWVQIPSSGEKAKFPVNNTAGTSGKTTTGIVSGKQVQIPATKQSAQADPKKGEGKSPNTHSAIKNSQDPLSVEPKSPPIADFANDRKAVDPLLKKTTGNTQQPLSRISGNKMENLQPSGKDIAWPNDQVKHEAGIEGDDLSKTAEKISRSGYLTYVPALVVKNKPAPGTLAIDTPVSIPPVIHVPLAGKPATPLSSRSWKWGIKFSAGVSTTRKGYLGIVGPGNTAESKAFADATLSSANPSAPATSPVYLPSNIHPLPGFEGGVYVQKGISTRSTVQIGLQYALSGSAMRIGSITRGSNNLSSSNFFYSSGTTSSYRNRFHFLVLPVSIHVGLGDQHSSPVSLNVGFTVSRLVHTNALQFDGQNGRYYPKNDLFNKTQAGISAGMLLPLSRKSLHPVFIGPDIKMGLTKIAGSGLYQNRRYSYFGIAVQKSLCGK